MPAVDALGTYFSAVRPEMPSGMVPVRELVYRYRPLKGVVHTRSPGLR
jgi:hypothetical protein